MFFSCNSEELYEIGDGVNYEVGSKTVSALLDCRKPHSYALRVKQQLCSSKAAVVRWRNGC